jgi:hypothetical protein
MGHRLCKRRERKLGTTVKSAFTRPEALGHHNPVLMDFSFEQIVN